MEKITRVCGNCIYYDECFPWYRQSAQPDKCAFHQMGKETMFFSSNSEIIIDMDESEGE